MSRAGREIVLRGTIGGERWRVDPFEGEQGEMDSACQLGRRPESAGEDSDRRVGVTRVYVVLHAGEEGRVCACSAAEDEEAAVEDERDVVDGVGEDARGGVDKPGGEQSACRRFVEDGCGGGVDGEASLRGVP